MFSFRGYVPGFLSEISSFSFLKSQWIITIIIIIINHVSVVGVGDGADDFVAVHIV